MTRMHLAGRTALITGAAGGIGRALAITLAARGCDLALCDRNEEGLHETADRCAPGRRITRHRLDVADAAAIAALPAAVHAAHGRVDLLVNNAGVALGGTVEQVSDADMHWLFDINFWGVVRMTRAFLPLLHASDDARLVNVSSLFGLVAPPGQAAYAASKYAVRGFTDALRHELEGTRIGVSTVHPGGVATAIATSARRPAGIPAADAAAEERRFARLLTLPPERAAAIIVAGIEQRRPRILVGRDARIASLLERIAPTGYWRILKRRA